MGSHSLFAIGGSHECDPYSIAAGTCPVAEEFFDRFNPCKMGGKRLYLPHPLSPSLHEMERAREGAEVEARSGRRGFPPPKAGYLPMASPAPQLSGGRDARPTDFGCLMSELFRPNRLSASADERKKGPEKRL